MRSPGPAIALCVLAAFTFSNAEALTESSKRNFLEHANEAWTGDLDGMVKRGFLRILTVHNPLLFSLDSEGEKGLVAELANLLDKHLGEEIGRVRSPTIVILPVARDELLPALLEGRGDLVMGNLTITPERQQQVDFGPPIYPNVEELVVTGPGLKDATSFDDFVESGIHVRRSSSYYEHLRALNAKRTKACEKVVPGNELACKKEIRIIAVDENLEDFDLLDMVDAGIIGATVIDSHKADFWEQVFDGIVVHRDLVLHSGSQIAWAMRKNSPQLMRSVSAFGNTVKKGTLLGNILHKRYLGNARWLRNSRPEEERERYTKTIEVIQEYARKYGFDWQIIVAQAYQESRLDQSKRSKAGAVGVMQLLPATAADKVVGIPDITTLENNIHAGIKYLHWLRKTYFSGDEIGPLDKTLFSFAAYNAGPGNMRRARRRTRQLKFDPDRWFGNVEIGMFRAVSGEPASYVRNIYRHYVTYQGIERTRRAREQALEAHPDIAGSSAWERRR